MNPFSLVSDLTSCLSSYRRVDISTSIPNDYLLKAFDYFHRCAKHGSPRDVVDSEFAMVRKVLQRVSATFRRASAWFTNISISSGR